MLWRVSQDFWFTVQTRKFFEVDAGSKKKKNRKTLIFNDWTYKSNGGILNMLKIRRTQNASNNNVNLSSQFKLLYVIRILKELIFLLKSQTKIIL